MKLNQIITGCALAVGLMACAPQSPAGVVINNTVYAPLNLKATFSYTANGKTYKVKFTNKDILSYWNYDQGTILAYAFSDGHVYAVNQQEGWVEDLTDYYGYDYLDVQLAPNSSTETLLKNGGAKYTAAGTMYVDFYSDADSNLIFNHIAFQTSGAYTLAGNQSGAKNGAYSVSEKFSSSNLTGEGYDHDADIYVDVKAAASAKGSGKLVEE